MRGFYKEDEGRVVVKSTKVGWDLVEGCGRGKIDLDRSFLGRGPLCFVAPYFRKKFQ